VSIKVWSRKKRDKEALNSWSGVGQFATKALQNTTSAVLNKALGQEGQPG